MGSCSPPSCKRTDPICCIDPRSGALFGQSMALDRLHKVRKAGAPGVGPYPKHKEAFWSRTGQRPHKRWRKGKHISFKTLPKAMGKWHKIIHPPATPKSYKGNSLALRQWCYYVGNHKVHIAFQNKAWLDLGRLEHKLSLTILCRLEQRQTYSVCPFRSKQDETNYASIPRPSAGRFFSPKLFRLKF